MYLIHAQFDSQLLEHIHDDRSQSLPLVLRLHLDLVAASNKVAFTIKAILQMS